MNHSGTLVGYGATAAGEFLPFEGNATGIRLFGNGGNYQATPRAISDDGRVAGSVYTGTRQVQAAAVVWSGGRVADLGITFGTGSRTVRPTGINDSGTVVGYDIYTPTTGVGGTVAFEWQAGKATALPGLGDHRESAYGVNNAGEVVGSVFDGSRDHAAAWVGGKLRIIDLPGSRLGASADAVNDAGVVVGATFAPDGNQATGTAFVYADGRTTPLDALVPTSSGLHFYAADDVNDLGQILAQATYEGTDELVVLTPPPISDLVATPIAEVAAVPEPTVAAVLAAVAAGRVLGRRRGRSGGDRHRG